MAAYEWKTGARINISAEKAGKVCEELQSKGELTAKNLVDVSRKKNAPLHDYFEWNDKVAGENYRELQAGHLIRCLEIKVEEKEPVRAYFSVTKDTAYTHIDTIVKNEDMTEALLAQCKRDIKIFMNKYEALEDYIGNVLDAMREVS